VKTAQEWRSAFWNTPCSCGVATMAAHCRDCSTKVFELAMADARAGAIEAEREACAMVAEELTPPQTQHYYAGRDIAHAIRRRGQP
jgi:hypothetical protein